MYINALFTFTFVISCWQKDVLIVRSDIIYNNKLELQNLSNKPIGILNIHILSAIKLTVVMKNNLVYKRYYKYYLAH